MKTNKMCKKEMRFHELSLVLLIKKIPQDYNVYFNYDSISLPFCNKLLKYEKSKKSLYYIDFCFILIFTPV